ncbi:Embryo-specific protein ATS3B [Vitis vinifera]|uniref:Embryo-specific protein ATS3B n=1 Tax=Vitis vinifera TaxID=29760 RepID=A0A438EEP2_VITVI|nr:Embryo-specific protein ATS3B [Vitis vinifera]
MLMLWRKDEKRLFSPSLSFHIHLLTSSINSFTPSCSQIPKFQFHPGECTYQICHVAFYRSGSDGWKPESVTIYGFNSRPVTFYYKRFIPKGIWFGFNHCSKASGFRLHNHLHF